MQPQRRKGTQPSSAATKTKSNSISATEGTEVTEKKQLEFVSSLGSLCPLWLKNLAWKTRNPWISIREDTKKTCVLPRLCLATQRAGGVPTELYQSNAGPFDDSCLARLFFASSFVLFAPLWLHFGTLGAESRTEFFNQLSPMCRKAAG
jgi:hypothetical protein